MKVDTVHFIETILPSFYYEAHLTVNRIKLINCIILYDKIFFLILAFNGISLAVNKYVKSKKKKSFFFCYKYRIKKMFKIQRKNEKKNMQNQ